MIQPSRPLAIGRYQILDLIGSGAMGVVYKAHDPAIGRDVAIKVVRIDTEDPQQRVAAVDRFRQEVQAAGRCSHPAIVGVFDFIDRSGDPAIVMELVDGTSLHRMRDPSACPASPVPAILLQVLEGLGYAHGQGIIHRDIKPANILVTPAGQAKIADFGIARLTDVAATVGGGMLGTPSYMAPEQLTDDTVDRRADLFAVGAILYEMLAGRPPFAGRTVSETVLRLSAADPADMSPIVAAGGGRFVPILQRALAKDRARRFQTADAFSAALQAVSATPRHACLDDPGATVVVAARTTRAKAFDPTLLLQVEAQLARFVGPIARRIVTQASQHARTPGDLFAAVAGELPNAADRSRFLRLVGGGRVEPSLGGRGRSGETAAGQQKDAATVSSPATSPATIAPALGGGSISPAAAAAAVALLVVHVGPIARVLVRDAVAHARSGRDFIDRLCAHVTTPADRAALQRRLQAVVEPKAI